MVILYNKLHLINGASQVNTTQQQKCQTNRQSHTHTHAHMVLLQRQSTAKLSSTLQINLTVGWGKYSTGELQHDVHIIIIWDTQVIDDHCYGAGSHQ